MSKRSTTAEPASAVTVTQQEPATAEQLQQAKLEQMEAMIRELQAKNNDMAMRLGQKETKAKSVPTVNFGVAGVFRGDTVNVPEKGQTPVRIVQESSKYKNTWELNPAHADKVIDRTKIDLTITLPSLRITPTNEYYPRLKGGFGSADLTLNDDQFTKLEAFCKSIGLDLANADQLQALRDKTSIIGTTKRAEKGAVVMRSAKSTGQQLAEVLGAKVSSPQQ